MYQKVLRIIRELPHTLYTDSPIKKKMLHILSLYYFLNHLSVAYIIALYPFTLQCGFPKTKNILYITTLITLRKFNIARMI